MTNYKNRNPITFFTVIFVIMMLPASFVSAQGQQTGEFSRYYLEGRINSSFSSLSNFNTSSFEGALQERNSSDFVVGIAGKIGYRWKNISAHSEIEGFYEYRFDLDYRDVSEINLGSVFNGFQSDISTGGILYNSAYEFRSRSDVTPYIGGSIGIGINSSETRDQKSDAISKNHTTNLIWGISGGLIWSLDNRWSVNVGMRYLDMGSAISGGGAIQEKLEGEDYQAYQALFGLRRYF